MISRTYAWTCATALTTLFAAVPASAQGGAASPATLQATLANDVGNLSDKFTGLARVMAGKYDWRPMQGVRSVGEVLNLIVAENSMLTNVLTGTTPPAGTSKPAPITDPAALQAALKTSYAALRDAVAKLSDSDLRAAAQIFGMQTTRQGATLIVLLDQHEHLGQSIAYARSNSVVPPWSK